MFPSLLNGEGYETIEYRSHSKERDNATELRETVSVRPISQE